VANVGYPLEGVDGNCSQVGVGTKFGFRGLDFRVFFLGPSFQSYLFTRMQHLVCTLFTLIPIDSERMCMPTRTPRQGLLLTMPKLQIYGGLRSAARRYVFLLFLGFGFALSHFHRQFSLAEGSS
jgi:hypothetical protein